MPQAVLRAALQAGVAAAAGVVRLGDAEAPVQQDLDDLVIVSVRRQDDGGDVWREGAGGDGLQQGLHSQGWGGVRGWRGVIQMLCK